MSDKYLRSEHQNLINGIGTELCWGWSPAVNFMEVLPLGALGRILGSNASDSSSSATIAPAATSEPPACPAQQQPQQNKNRKSGGFDLDQLLADFDVNSSKKPTATTASSSTEVNSTPRRDDDDGVHILLCGACDIRHIFRTVAAQKVLMEQKKTSSVEGGGNVTPKTLHFHIWEPNLRVHARHLFFLQWLSDAIFSFDKLEDQVSMFLEVFGNILLRDITAVQVKDVASRALRTVGYQEGPLAPLVTFNDMKAKEKDFVEDQMKHWTKDSSVAHIEANWNNRLRTEMAERYDNKENIIDWDFNFHLYEYTNAIKFPEYRTWRNSGIAFDYCHINPRKGFQYEYTVPNKSLCHFNRQGHGVFLGDIKNGPFYTIGIDTRNEKLRPRNVDGTLKYGNGVTAMHNVRAWLYELMCGKEWPWADHAFAWDDAANYNYLPPDAPSDVAFQATLPPVKFHFVGLDLERFLLHHREEKRPLFDAMFVGSNSTQVLTPNLFAAASPDAPVVCETVKFVVDCQDETKGKFVEKIMEFGKRAGWAEDTTKTGFLHRDQPEPRKVESLTLSEAQKKTAARLQSKFFVVLKKIVE